MAKLAKKLPSRVTNVKAAAKRQRSWAQNQRVKAVNIEENDRARRANLMVGCTGKQRYSNPRHALCDNLTGMHN